MSEPAKPHPCHVGPNDYDHDFEVIDASCGDEIYFQQILYMQCKRCGETQPFDGYSED